MSAEVEAAEVTIRVISSAIEAALRIAPTAAATVFSVARRTCVFAFGALTSGSLHDITKSTSGASLLSVRDEDFPKLAEEAKKLNIKIASVDITPLDGWTDFVVSNDKISLLNSIIQRLEMMSLKKDMDSLGEETIPAFEGWAEKLKENAGTLDEQLNRDTSNLNTARTEPYAVCDRLNPENHILISPTLEKDKNGKEYVMSTYELYKEGIKVSELNDKREDALNNPGWKSLKATMQSATGINPDDVLYFNTTSELERYRVSYMEAKSPTPEGLLKLTDTIEPEKMIDPEYKENVTKSLDYHLKNYVSNLKRVQDENPTLAHDIESQGLDRGPNGISQENAVSPHKGLKETADELKANSPVKQTMEAHGLNTVKLAEEIEEFKASLPESLGESEKEILDGYTELASINGLISAEYKEIDDSLTSGISAVTGEAEAVTNLDQLESKVVLHNGKAEIYKEMYAAQRKYVDALKAGDLNAAKQSQSIVEMEREVLKNFTESYPDKSVSQARSELFMGKMKDIISKR